MNKHILRKSILEKRMLLKANDITEKSLKIAKKIKMLNEYKESNIIAIYYPIKNEVNLLSLIGHKKVVFPKVSKNIMNFHKTNSISDLKKGSFNILEPTNNLIDKSKIDLILVPGVAFSKSKDRIGFGKGFYDKYLSNYTGKKIGVCFDMQLVDHFETSWNDIKLDKIVTESFII